MRILWTLVNIIVSCALLVWALRLGRAAWPTLTSSASSQTTATLVGVTACCTGSRIEVTFGAAMVASGTVGEEPTAKVRLAPDLPGRWFWDRTDHLVFQARDQLPSAQRFTIALDPGLRSADGRPVAQEAWATSERPRLLQASAWESADRQGVLLTFNVPVLRSVLAQHLEVSCLAGTAATELVPTDQAGQQTDPTLPSSTWKVLLPIPAFGQTNPTCRVRMKAGWRAASGDLPNDVPCEQQVSFLETLEVDAVQGDPQGLSLRLNRCCEPPLAGQWRMEPPADLRAVLRYDGLHLLGSLPPGEAVTLVLPAGFPGQGKVRLPSAFSKTVIIGDLPPSLTLDPPGEVLVRSAIPRLDLRGVNIREVECRLAQAYPNNLLLLARQLTDPDRAAFGPSRRLRLSTGSTPNRPFSLALDLSGLWAAAGGEDSEVRCDRPPQPGGPMPSGVYHLQIRALEAHTWVEVERTLFVTDLGLSARTSGNQVAVRVRSLADGTPVVDGQVRILTRTNQERATGRTDAQGLVVLTWEPRLPDSEPFLILAETATDRTAIDFRHFATGVADPALAGTRPRAAGLEAWIHPDRGLVAPGDELRAMIAIRDRDGSAPVGRLLRLAVRDAQGRVRSERDVVCPPEGLLDLRQPTAVEDLSGTWSFTVAECRTGELKPRLIGSAPVRLECHVPARLSLQAAIEGECRFGGTAVISGQAAWLSGEPAGGRTVTLRPYHLLTTPDLGPAWTGWSCGPQSSQEQAPPGSQPAVTAATDDHGRFRVVLPLPLNPPAQHQALRLQVELRLEDPAGREVHRVVRAQILPSEGVVVLRCLPQGPQVRCEVALVDPRGKVLDQEEIIPVSVERCQWEEASSGNRRWTRQVHREVVGMSQVRLEHGRGLVLLHRPERSAPGWREWSWLVAVARRSSGGLAEDPWSDLPAPPDRLACRCDAAAILPGQTALVHCTAPQAGEALFTLEGEGIAWSRVLPLLAGENRLSIPIPSACPQPTLHLLATQTTGVRSRSGAWWAVGGTSLTIDHPERRLSPQLLVPERIGPGEDLPILIQAPGASQAMISIVDVGVLELTGHPAPDPLGFFLARRSLDGRGADSAQRLITCRFPEPETGGDAEPARLDGLANRLGSTVIVEAFARLIGPIPLDAEGRGEATCSLPKDYEGRVRVGLVVAGSKALGRAAADVPVAAPLGLAASGPVQLAPEDRSRATINVINRTGTVGQCRIRLRSGPGLSLAEPGRWQVRGPKQHTAIGPDLLFALPAGAQAELVVPVQATAPGAGGLTLDGELQGCFPSLHPLARFWTLPGWEEEGTLTRRRQLALPVQAVGLRQSSQRALLLDTPQEFRLPGRWAGPVTLQVRLSTDVEDRLLPALVSLLEYPYGCVEQTSARLWGLVACQRLLPRLGQRPGHQDLQKGTTLLDLGVQRLCGMLHPDGGFGWWPSDPDFYPFGSANATAVLVAASRSGAAIPGQVLPLMLDRLEKHLRSADDRTRCHLLATLSEGGRPVGSWCEAVASRSQDLDEESRCLLALALARSERTTAAARLLANLATQQAVAEQNGLLGSPLRTQAYRLRARLAATPSDPEIPLLAGRLCAVLDTPERMTTQERSQALLALATWFDRRPARPAQHQPATIEIVDAQGAVSRTLTGPMPLEQTLTLDHGASLRLSGAHGLACLSWEGLRLDPPPPQPGQTRLKAWLLDTDTKACIDQPRRGRTYQRQIRLELPTAINHLLVTDCLPAGLEIERDPAVRQRGMSTMASHVEFRHDRALCVFTRAGPGTITLSYPVLAVTPGTYQPRPIQSEALYLPGSSTWTCGTDLITVVDDAPTAE